MPLFTYKAQLKTGEVINDSIQGVNKPEVAMALKAKGLTVLTINEIGKTQKLAGGRITVSEKAALARFLATMLRSGMSLPEAIDIIRQETKNKRLGKILSDISFQTQKGKSLSSVLEQYKKDFDVIFQTMVRVGEESGTLEKSFDYLAKQLTSSHDLSQKIKGAMMYPAIIILAMIGNGLMMGVFVLPRIAGAFLKINVELPAYTKIILNTGEFIGNNAGLTVITTILSLILMGVAFAFKPTRDIIIRILTKIPVIRKVVQQIDIARFARTLSTLLKSGVPIIDALDVSADTLTQRKYKMHAKEFSKSVAKGESLSDVLIRTKGLFPSIMIQTIRAGEKAGSLEDVLAEMASFYEREIEYSLKNLISLLEPVLMLLIGIVVGIMVIVMIAPIYSIIGGLQSTIQSP